MNVLVLVNGEVPDPEIVRRRLRSVTFDCVIGVDGGSCHATTLGVALDTIIGDMDSLPDNLRNNAGNCRFITHPVEKDATDLELALNHAVEQKADRIVMAGAVGGRLDMTIANVMLLIREQVRECRIEIWDGEQTAWLVRPPGEDVPGNPGDTVSFIPLGGAASGITLNGFAYHLDNATLSPGETRGVSNVINKTPARVSYTRGLLLAVHTPTNLEYKTGGLP